MGFTIAEAQQTQQINLIRDLQIILIDLSKMLAASGKILANPYTILTGELGEVLKDVNDLVNTMRRTANDLSALLDQRH